jgi:MYXO-CTERM domain-containing protein
MVTSDADALFNIHPFLHYSQGCYNGAFDNCLGPEMGNRIDSLDCFAEHLLLGENGAFATASNSRYGLGSYGTDGPSNRFHRQFWDAFFAEGASTIGEAFADSKDDNANAISTDTGVRWAGFTVNLLGDPALALKKSINTTDPLLGVYPPGFRFFSRLGDPAPEPAELFVRNDGVGQLSFSAAADQTWITITPDSGPAPQDLAVQVDPAGLGAGTHEGVITVSSPDAPNSPVEVTVEQIVIEVPQIRVPHLETAPSVNGTITPGEYDGALALPIDEEETGDVTLFMTVSGNRLYLAVDDLTDLTDGQDEIIFLFDRDLDGQWPDTPGIEGVYWLMGRWNMFIPIYNPGGEYQMGNWQQNPLGFRAEVGMQDSHRIYEISLDLNSSRLDTGPYGVFGMYLQVRDTFDWNIREVTGSWPLWVPQIDDQRFFGKVDMAPEGPRLDTTPASLLFNAVVDQPAPASQNLSVFDREGGNIAFTTSTSDSWLLVSPANGQTPGDVTVSIDHSELSSGDHSGEVIIEAATWNSPYKVPVTLRIWEPAPKLSVDPDSLHITAVADGPDPSAALNVANIGGQPMDFAIFSSVTWLRADPNQGAIGPNSSQVVTMTADLASLDQGSHTAEITVRGIMAEDGRQIVPAQVDVVAPRPVPPVEDLSLGVLDQSLQLTWTCPDDPIVSGVLIRKGVGAPPAGPQLGEMIYDGLEERHTDEGLLNGTSYCYSAFAYDAAGRYAEPATACGVPGPNRKPPVPELLSPASGAAVPATPELVASTVLDPDGDVVAYTFVLLGSSGNTLDSEVVEGSGNRVSWLPNAELQPEIAYRWQVEAVDSQGAHSGFGETRSFTIRPPTDAGSPDGGQPPGDGDPDCGCGHTDSPAPGLLLLVAGMLFLRRRRS